MKVIIRRCFRLRRDPGLHKQAEVLPILQSSSLSDLLKTYEDECGGIPPYIAVVMNVVDNLRIGN